jgi:hypothetical protein
MLLFFSGLHDDDGGADFIEAHSFAIFTASVRSALQLVLTIIKGCIATINVFFIYIQ